MRITFLAIVYFVLTIPSIFCQGVNQDSIGKVFLNNILNGSYDASWAMLNKEAFQEITYEDYLKICKQVKMVAGEAVGVTYFMDMVMLGQNGRPTSLKIYKLESDVSKGMEGLLFQIIFLSKDDRLISGFQWKFQQAMPLSDDPPERISTSIGREDQLSGEDIWEVKNKEYTINEVALIYFSEDKVMLAIKVYYDFETMSVKEATEIATPIVKEAIRLKWLKIAKKKAKQENKQLIENIGVALIKPGETSGYRIQITPRLYNY